MQKTPPDAGRMQARPATNWDSRWEKRRAEIIAEITPALRAQYPELSWQQLNVLIDKRADLRLIYDRFSHEP